MSKQKYNIGTYIMYNFFFLMGGGARGNIGHWVWIGTVRDIFVVGF